METAITIKGILEKESNYKGIYSVCSADPLVLEASFGQALEDGSPLLIEATCNQVNQYGGYTGMKPADFSAFVYALAEKIGYDTDSLILGGDHLGTQPFRHLSSAEATERACIMAADYVRAGFSKIHLDASAPCRDDAGLSTEDLTRLACERSAEMALSIKKLEIDADISYVIGTEVPPPGGSVDDETEVTPTAVEDAAATIRLSLDAFKRRNLNQEIEDIIALVVQPGVEFSDTHVHTYDRRSAEELTTFIRHQQGMVFEAHSTDYQTTAALRDLVEDGFVILKVGPALTYAKRRALFALARVETELFGNDRASNLSSVIEEVMVSRPVFWESHYRGDERNRRLSRQFSLSDRVRYYWHDERISTAVDTLMLNLRSCEIPQTLLYEFVPELYWDIRDGVTKADPRNIVLKYIQMVLWQYAQACGPR